jgi:hypothetical protein
LDDTVTEPSQDFVPAPFEPADLQSDVLDLISENSALRAPLNGFGVRKVLIGLVGGLFVLGLVSLVSDLIAKSAPVETVAVQSFEELFAEGGGAPQSSPMQTPTATGQTSTSVLSRNGSWRNGCSRCRVTQARS